MLRADLDAPRKQRHTVKRIFDRLLDSVKVKSPAGEAGGVQRFLDPRPALNVRPCLGTPWTSWTARPSGERGAAGRSDKRPAASSPQVPDGGCLGCWHVSCAILGLCLVLAAL